MMESEISTLAAGGDAPVVPALAPGGSISPERTAIVARACDTWKQRLVDLSRRNSLLYFRDLRVGTLDISPGGAEAIERLLAGDSVAIDRLASGGDDRAGQPLGAAKLRDCVRKIGRRAQANMEERGLHTLFAAFDFASWTADDGGSAPRAPLALLPVELVENGPRGRLQLKSAGDLQVNVVLLQQLRAFGVDLDPDSISGGGALEDHSAGRRLISRALLAAASGAVPGFSISPGAVLGNFAYQKLAMVKDLEECGGDLAACDMVAALAGDTEVSGRLQREDGGAVPAIDSIDPDGEFMPLDADASQLEAIYRVMRKRSLVIQGPPGTGKSQTIANLISMLCAYGASVLFVAEKRAALEVVYSRLAEKGLEHLALDLHGADVSRKKIADRLGASLSVVKSSLAPDATAVHERYRLRRATLQRYVQAITTPIGTSGVRLFDLHGQLLALKRRVDAGPLWREPELSSLSGERADQIEELLRAAMPVSDLVSRSPGCVWSGATMPDGEAALDAVAAVDALLAGCSETDAAARDLAALLGLEPPGDVEGAARLAHLAADAAALGARYREELFEVCTDRFVEALAPAGRGGLAHLWALLTSAEYRRGLGTLRSLADARSGTPERPLDRVGLLHDAGRAAAVSSGFARLGLSRPVMTGGDGAERLLRALASIEKPVSQLRAWNVQLGAADTLSGMRTAAGALAAQREAAKSVPEAIRLEGELRAAGAAELLAVIRRDGVRAELWPEYFRCAWLTSWRDAYLAKHPELAAFLSQTHNSVVADFKGADMSRLDLASQRLRRRHGERVTAVRNQYPEQSAIVVAQTTKSTRHMPLRRLCEAGVARDVVMALCPCWMASPLAVSQLIPREMRFDVVIFDEASQVLTEDAIPSLMRGVHAVVAGDRKQLPPTVFFASGADPEGETDEAEQDLDASGYESLLDLAASRVPQQMLTWHYRSRHESLIAFSNRLVYDNRLVTFPSTGETGAIRHVLVKQAPGRDGQEESVSEEVARVVQLVLEHARERSSESLGVITMGIRHANRIQQALDLALDEFDGDDDFFSSTRQERFFIKNLERVQGDERDAIILSIGYGKSADGKLPYRFGPLLHAGGERRLNVAVTRARNRMTLVSSFSHLDMDPGRSSKEGVRLLRAYLEYAASAGARFGDDGAEEVAPNDFEQDVFDALSARGIELVPQYGACGYRIDMVARHPGQPGRFVLAIECDGAQYHSAYVARDRDRLRQEVLEARGWRFHRIWSTDWFKRREEEIERAVAAYHDALQRCEGVEQAEPGEGGGQPAAAVAPASEADDAAPVRARTEPPPVRPHGELSAYTDGDLVRVVRWICSDGLLRSDEEIRRAALEPLGISRMGSRVQARLDKAIAQANGTYVTPAVPPRSGPVPVRGLGDIRYYTDRDLQRLIVWVSSDGVNRTHNETCREAIKVMAISRLGPVVRARLEAAINAVERAGRRGR